MIDGVVYLQEFEVSVAVPETEERQHGRPVGEHQGPGYQDCCVVTRLAAPKLRYTIKS